jgi:hypothetical protein
MPYEAFDNFLNVDTWHTRHPNDEARFFIALGKVINDPQFNADRLGEYMREKKCVSRDDAKNTFNFDIDHYVAAAWAVRGYLKANRLSV